MSNRKTNGTMGGKRQEDGVLFTVRRNVELLRLEVEYMELLIKRNQLTALLGQVQEGQQDSEDPKPEKEE